MSGLRDITEFMNFRDVLSLKDYLLEITPQICTYRVRMWSEINKQPIFQPEGKQSDPK